MQDSFRNKNTIHAVTIRENATINQVCFFGHDLLVAYSTDSKVRVVLAHNIEQDVLVLQELNAQYMAIAGCLDKELLAVADQNTLRVYDFRKPPSHMVVATIELQGVRALDFTEDGEKLVAGVWSGAKVFVRETTWGEISSSDNLGGGGITSVQFDNSNEYFVVACNNGTPRKVYANDMNIVKEFDEPGAKTVFVSSQGKYLAVASPKGAVIFDYGNGRKLQTLSDGGNTFQVSISRGERFVMASLSTSRVTIWDIESNFARVVALIEHGRGVRMTAISKDDRTMLSVGGDQTILMMGLVERRVFGHAHAHSNNIFDIDISPDDKVIASCGMDCSIRFTDASTLKPIHTLRNHNNTVNSVCFSPDGRYLASGGMDSTIKVVDLSDYSNYLSIPGEGWTTVYCVRFSSDSTKMAFTADNAVRVWDVQTKTELHAMEGHTKIVRSLSFSTTKPNILYSGGHDRCIRVWDIESGKELGKMEGHNNFVLRVQTTPDGKYLVSSSSDNSVRVWNLETLTPLSVMNGHTAYVKGLHISNCGQYILSGGLDKQVIVWDMKTKKRLAVLLDENIKFNCVRIRSDLKRIYAGGEIIHDIKCWLFVSDDEMVASRASPLVHNFKRYIR